MVSQLSVCKYSEEIVVKTEVGHIFYFQSCPEKWLKVVTRERDAEMYLWPC